MMKRSTGRHIHDKAASGTVYDTVKGTWVYKYLEVKCSKCGKYMGKRLIGKVESPLRRRMGAKSGKMIWDVKKGKRNS